MENTIQASVVGPLTTLSDLYNNYRLLFPAAIVGFALYDFLLL